MHDAFHGTDGPSHSGDTMDKQEKVDLIAGAIGILAILAFFGILVYVNN